MAKDFMFDDGSDGDDAAVQVEQNTTLKINEDYARKFTYNKKQEDIRQLEDKFSSKNLKRKRPNNNPDAPTDSDTDTSSESESEDDAGGLATETLDSEILATLNAIKARDPRVYDKEATFYTPTDKDVAGETDQPRAVKEKPVYLRDYHRDNLLRGTQDGTTEVQEPQHATPTYAQEQEALKQSILQEINTATAGDASDVSSDLETVGERKKNGFLVSKPQKEKREDKPSLDVENADKDPETFLSNFLSARAWVPNERSRFQPLESDDDEDERKAQEFEEAYNFRFENPSKTNEKLVSHARDVAAKYSVRREEKNARKKQREAEKERKIEAKREKHTEKARYKRLKVEEAEEKLSKIKKAAGLTGQVGLSPEDLSKFLGADWSDGEWDEEMRKTFGEGYYEQDDVNDIATAQEPAKRNQRPKKPRWEDDIEITDLVPGFDEGQPTFNLSNELAGTKEFDESAKVQGQHKSAKARRKDMESKKQQVHKERKTVEQIIEDRLDLDTALASSQKDANGFRYRQTSPLSFGLSAQDILMAEDSQLNEFVGLKKLASFRDPSKKRKDQKRLGKKARLRQWRRDTFGGEEEPGPNDKIGLATKIGHQEGELDAQSGNVEGDSGTRVDDKKRKRRRRKGVKGAGSAALST